MAALTTTVLLDLHVHTNYSHDGHDSVEKLIASALAQKLDGIAICDHDTMEGFFAARDYVAEKNLAFIIVPGIEVTTSKGHLIVLGIEDEGIEKGLTLEETIRIARMKEKEHNGTVALIAPHPYHPFRHSIGNGCVHPEIDAIEIFNSRYFTGIGNALARITAARNAITPVAGSDAHSAECVGLATVEVEVESELKPDAEAIVRGIKAVKVRINNCKRTPLWVYFKHLVLKRH
jgi:predicted metal-dependent phosphoesterase TrpH